MKKKDNNQHSNLQALTLFKVIGRAATLPARIFLIFGIVLLLFGIKKVYDAHQSNAWLPVNGVITISTIQVDTSTTTGVGGRHNTTTSTSYAPEISYDYTLAGIKYSNSGIILGGNVGTGSYSRARRLINKYPAGAQVTVYYNPQDPYQSVLERGVHLETWFVAGFGLAFIAFTMLWRHTTGKIARLFQLSGSSANKKSRAFSVSKSQDTVTTRQPRKSTNTHASGLVGKWKILKQLPPQSELTKIIKTEWGIPDASSAVYPDTGETIVVITESTISFVTKGLGAFGDQSIPYTVDENTLLLGQVEKNFLAQKMKPFFASFYYYHFAGEQLVLTSNPIKGYQNRSITYFLSKV